MQTYTGTSPCVWATPIHTEPVPRTNPIHPVNPHTEPIVCELLKNTLSHTHFTHLTYSFMPCSDAALPVFLRDCARYLTVL